MHAIIVLHLMALQHVLVCSPLVRRYLYLFAHTRTAIQWFDNNNVRFFGGLNPSRWGDGNPLAWQMNADIRMLSKFIPRIGVGSVEGANVCSETWYTYVLPVLS